MTAWHTFDSAPRDGSAFLAYGTHTEDSPEGASPQVRKGDHWWAIILYDVWQQHRFRFAKDGAMLWSEPTHWQELTVPRYARTPKPLSADTEGDAG